MYIPDPIELLDSKMERLQEDYVDEHSCMECKKKVDYELVCVDPMGYGPLVCMECAGIGHI